MTSPHDTGTKPYRTTGKLTGLVVRCAVTLGLLWLLAANVDLEAVGKTFASASPGWIVATLVLAFTQPVLGTGRWRIVCRQLGKPLHFLMLLRFTLIGVFFNQCLPSTVGGDAVRIWLARRAGFRLGGAVNSVLIDRLVALAALALLSIATLPALFARVADPIARNGVMIGLAAIAGGLVLIVVIDRLFTLPARFRLSEAIAKLADGVRDVMFKLRPATAVMGMSLGIHLITIAMMTALAIGLGVPVGFLDCLVLVPPVILASVVPISLAGWGVREGAMVAAFGFIGVAAHEALALSVAFGLVIMLTGGPGGVLWMMAGANAQPEPEA